MPPHQPPRVARTRATEIFHDLHLARPLRQVFATAALPPTTPECTPKKSVESERLTAKKCGAKEFVFFNSSALNSLANALTQCPDKPPRVSSRDLSNGMAPAHPDAVGGLAPRRRSA